MGRGKPSCRFVLIPSGASEEEETQVEAPGRSVDLPHVDSVEPMRNRRIIGAVFAAAALLPLIVVGVLSADNVGTWLSTGFCPGGAMDQHPGPCHFFTFFLRVFLGGWAAFVVLPFYVAWWLLCFVVWRWTMRRARSEIRKGQRA